MDKTDLLGVFCWKTGVPEVPMRSSYVRDQSENWMVALFISELSVFSQSVQCLLCPVLLLGEIELINS